MEEKYEWVRVLELKSNCKLQSFPNTHILTYIVQYVMLGTSVLCTQYKAHSIDTYMYVYSNWNIDNCAMCIPHPESIALTYQSLFILTQALNMRPAHAVRAKSQKLRLLFAHRLLMFSHLNRFFATSAHVCSCVFPLMELVIYLLISPSVSTSI